MPVDQVEVGEDPARENLRGQFKDARTLALLLREKLLAIVAVEGQPAGTRTDATDAALKDANTERANSTPGLLEVASLVEQALNADPHLDAKYGGEVRRITTDLKNADTHWPVGNDTATVIANAKKAESDLHEVILRITKLIATRRVNEQLEQTATGQPINNDTVFGADEGLEPDDVKEIIQVLAQRPHDIPEGWVNVSEQRIYKLPHGKGRWVRGLAPFLWLVLAVIGVSVAGKYLPNDWPAGTAAAMCGAFGLVLAGAALHFITEMHKSKRLQQWSAKVPVVSEWTKWWVLHPMAPLGLLVAPLLTLAALIAAKADPGGVEGSALFILAGYSADSIANAWIDRLGGAAAKATKVFTDNTPVKAA